MARGGHVQNNQVNTVDKRLTMVDNQRYKNQVDRVANLYTRFGKMKIEDVLRMRFPF